MKTYQIKSQIWFCVFVIFIFLLSSAFLVSFIICILHDHKYTLNEIFFICSTISLILIFLFLEIRQNLISIFSGPVTIEWDGKTLRILDRNSVLATVDNARWVYREPQIIVIAGATALNRFNRGHVRSNGRELTVGAGYGRGLDDLSEQIASLGPQKKWLWRRMPFF